MRVALIQMLVTADKAANLRSACEKIRAAKQAGADIAVLPEMFCCPYENRCFRAYGEEAGGEVQQTLSRLAAFNMTTGPAHWELLFRQRAVDNQCFTVGVSPARDEQASYVAYGNSLAVDPWGTVLCRAGAEETTLLADLDLHRLEAVRKQLPILSARRTDLYEVREH